jgi:hypothetical protein
MRETERTYGGGDVRDGLLAAVEKWKGEAASLRAQLADREREVATRREQVDSLATANEAANRRAEAAERERDEARFVLRDLEWFGFGFCPACNGEKPQGHYKGCSLAACLPPAAAQAGEG